MNAMSHLKYMVLGGLGLLAVALLAGVPLASALPLAILLACPLMMVFMMKGMHGGHGETTNEHAHGGAEGEGR